MELQLENTLDSPIQSYVDHPRDFFRPADLFRAEQLTQVRRLVAEAYKLGGACRYEFNGSSDRRAH